MTISLFKSLAKIFPHDPKFRTYTYFMPGGKIIRHAARNSLLVFEATVIVSEWNDLVVKHRNAMPSGHISKYPEYEKLYLGNAKDQ